MPFPIPFVEVVSAVWTKRLVRPRPSSRKGDNGVLLVIGGSEKYHGAPLYAIEAASSFADLIFFHSPAKEHRALLFGMRKKSREFIWTDAADLDATAKRADCILMGNGMGVSPRTKTIVNGMLRRHKNKKFVLDADALKVADKRLFAGRVMVTPHAGEFSALFGKPASAEEAKKQAAKWKCVVLLKGKADLGADIISDGKRIAKNTAGNAGMTKGGTGDVLAGLAAALACKNSLFLSACAAAYLNGAAGDRLFKRFGFRYNASDLAKEVACRGR
ncbi:ADP-dependent (S)-NAD(P)H-hydrate dehydratase [Candidatus Norongarragalina meridionalis]|nr:ADP-dependent (S)-NAD(P)H-hydrate dehydratase [Candidatus Norongarragalina meridionalis]